jgi:hypothetical protein
MNGYVCFFKQQRFECHAETVLEAKQKAIAHFKVRPGKTWMVSVVLAEKDGKDVTHTGGET